MAYSLNPSSDNCYEGTTCLVNKLGIRDEKKLAEIEAGITFAKAVMLEETPIDDDFGFEHLQLIRHYGYDINFADVDTDELMIATIQASSGVMDFLVDFFENSIVVPA